MRSVWEVQIGREWGSGLGRFANPKGGRKKSWPREAVYITPKLGVFGTGSSSVRLITRIGPARHFGHILGSDEVRTSLPSNCTTKVCTNGMTTSIRCKADFPT